MKEGQDLTFCGVGAYHQNDVVESKIKKVCYGGRTILLHSKCNWPSMISIAMWHYAVQAIVEWYNCLSFDEDVKAPIEKFSGIKEEITPKGFHTFGYPDYMLEAANQSGIGAPKWDPRSRTGIYLGHSPCHAGSVSLGLNLTRGLVSPQYHVFFYDKFTTVLYLESIDEPPN